MAADDKDDSTQNPSREVLTADRLREWAKSHHPWAVGQGDDRLLRTFKFRDFNAAMHFMASVAPVADELNHHPEWSNVYNKVWVELTTHDAGGVTEADLRLASVMDASARGIGLTD